jgi:hypothetical protein
MHRCVPREATVGSEGIACFIVSKYLHATRGVGQNERAHPEAELIGTDPINAAIMKAFGANPLSSVHELSWPTCLSTSVVDQHSIKSLGCGVSEFCEDPQKVRNNEGRPR